jgi:glycosyltransferase involved in cell wall biosynthesis
MSGDRSLSIAILGTRGVPPRYGGFETFAAELGSRLANRGHAVTVYCRRALYEGEPQVWCGIRRVELPAIRQKYLETVSHALLSSIHALGSGYDAVLVCNAANAFVLPLLRAGRTAVAINVDGIERRRRKWNALGRAVYLAGEVFSAAFADVLIADAKVIAAYYARQLGAASEIIAYGSDFPFEPDTDVLERLGVSPHRYVLYVSRFEPENNPLAVIEAYRGVGTELPLVMVGDAPYSRDLIAEMKARADERVVFPGALYGADYRTLQRHALVYVQATEVGGTHPALIEAMGSGGAVVANGTPENIEVGGPDVMYFDARRPETLTHALQAAIDHPSDLDAWRRRARQRARAYSWDEVTSRYEALFRRIAGVS